MDTATHLLLGVATAGAFGFSDRVGRVATCLAAALALLPDLDFLASLGSDPWAARLAHRGFSHSLLLCALAPAPLAFVASRFAPGTRFLTLYLCSLVAMLGHPFLDLCTSYGTRVLEPFSHARFAWHVVGIIDFVYTGLLIVALAAASILRGRGSALAAQGIALAGLLLSGAYLGLGALNHHRAVEIGRAEASRLGLRPTRIEAYPLIGTVMGFRLLVETEDAFRVARVNFLNSGGPPHFNLAPKSSGPGVAAALRDPLVQRYVDFALGTVRPILVEREGEASVELDDMRYGFPADNPESIWAARAVLDSRGAVQRVEWVQRAQFRARFSQVLATFLRDMFGE